MTPDTTESKQADRARTLIDDAIDACERDEVPAGAVLVALREADARIMPRIRAERDAHAASAARLTAALGEATASAPPKAPRKPRAARAETTPEQREALVLESLALKSPQTLQEVATMAVMPRAAAQIAIDALLTSEQITRQRAGKGWRYHWIDSAKSGAES